MHHKFSLLLFCFFVILLAETSRAQSISSGRKFIVAQKDKLSNDANPGTSKLPFKTISKAAAIAKSGDTVLVYAGIYREWVAPASGGEEGKPLVYMAAPGEKVYIRGSEVYKGKWVAVQGKKNIFYTTILSSFFDSTFNPFKIVFSDGRGGGRQGQVFIDGKELLEAGKNISTDNDKQAPVEKNRMNAMYQQPGTWATEDGETIYIHLPSNAKPLHQSLIEFSVRRHLFAPVRRAQDYINVKGFIFEHCANDVSFPQVGAVSCRSGQHWIIENNIIRNIKTIGLDCGAEDEDPWLLPDILPEDRFFVSRHHDIFKLSERRIPGRHLILNNKISDCGQCGIAGLFSDGTVVMGNTVERCGKVIPGFETGGIKFHGLMGGTVEANLVRDNESWGIWLDCGYIGSRVTRNVVINNNISGIFFECSNGPGLIDNNIIAYNRGDGIYAHDASGVNIINNLIFNNTNFGIYMCVATDRLVPPYHYATGLYENELSACSWQRIYNNMVVTNKEGAISLPFPSKRAEDNASDYNLFENTTRPADFVLHVRNGENLKVNEADAQAQAAFLKTGDPGFAGEQLALWKNGDGLAMNLDQWQKKTGNDKNSKTSTLKINLNQQTYQLQISLDSMIWNLLGITFQVPAIRDFEKFPRQVDKDFMSVPVTDSNLRVGAFQKIKPGLNQFSIWPIKFQYPPMPPKVKEQPLPGSDAFKPVPKPTKQ